MVEATNNVIVCTNTAYVISYSQSHKFVWRVTDDGQLTQNWEALKVHNDFNADIYKCKKTYQFKTHCKDDAMISLH